MSSDLLQASRENLEKAGIPLTWSTSTGMVYLEVKRPDYVLQASASLGRSFSLYGRRGMTMALRLPGQKVEMDVSSIAVLDLQALDTMAAVQRILQPLKPTWSSTKPILMVGKNPGDPVLRYYWGDDKQEPLEIIPRPASINALHKYGAVKCFSRQCSPNDIADFIRKAFRHQQPTLTWPQFTDAWNARFGSKFGHKLSCANSYIYAWNGIRFLIEGKDLLIDIDMPIDWRATEEVRELLDSVMTLAKELGVAPTRPYEPLGDIQ